ncbi:MAG: peptide deformylase [Clostridiales Family XIII bacterium]|jgi:peptide deformylase|nr:peptide deformylase [Clostridiales Family XIII bacterium]
MALRKVVLEGDEVLRKRSKEVKEISGRVLELIDDMWETLAERNGVGLAAPQVGVLKRVAVIDTGEEGERLELVNPELLETEGSVETEEGCLSLPGFVGTVARPRRVKARALDREGREFVVEGSGLLAKALCHEIDHLDGVLYTDKATSIRALDDEESEEGS